MKSTLVVPEGIERAVRDHLFQSEIEQGAFLFSRTRSAENELLIEVVDCYLIPAEGWEVQLDVYLEMKDQERGKIMKMARDCGVVDCHSHPDSQDEIAFSPSDRKGITEFAAYAKWKLPGKPYVAMVWGESSVDAVVWHDSFEAPWQLGEVRVTSPTRTRVATPRGKWFWKSKPYWRREARSD